MWSCRVENSIRATSIGKTFERLESRVLLTAGGADSRAVWFESIPSGRDSLVVQGASLSNPLADPTVDLAHTHKWIVQLAPDAFDERDSPSAFSSMFSKLGVTVRGGLGRPGWLQIASNGDLFATEHSLRGHPAVVHVESVEPVAGVQVPNDPVLPRLDGLKAINAEDAWNVSTGSQSVVVGVIDTGIDIAHPDLYLNVWLNEGEIPASLKKDLVDIDNDGLITFYDLNGCAEGDPSREISLQCNYVTSPNALLVTDVNANGYIDGRDLLLDRTWSDREDTDGNEFVDDLVGWDFQNNDNDPSDDHLHGTHVAGTIGAIGNNGLGSSGVAWRVSMMPVKALDETNSGTNVEAMLALNYATMMRRDFGVNVRLTNNSYGFASSFSNALQESIAASRQADMLFVAAAGNGDLLGQGFSIDTNPFYPASYSADNIIAVAAAGVDKTELAPFSNFGSCENTFVDCSVDVSAPGVGIFSARAQLDGGERERIVASRNGTSMATPHVSGVAALVLSERPNASAQEVRQAIFAGSVGTTEAVRHGHLDAFAALRAQTFGPEVRLVSAADISGPQTEHVVVVNYSDSDGINTAEIDESDIRLSRAGFSDLSLSPSLSADDIVIKSVSDVTGLPVEVEATYRFVPPKRDFDIVPSTWHAIDNGDYEIVLRFDEVSDFTGIAAGQRTLGSFSVQIEDESVLFVRDERDLTLNELSICDEEPLGCNTLRSAVQIANNRDNSTLIVIPDGIYPLVKSPDAGDDETGMEVSGDLDIRANIFLVGAGAESATIDARFLDRALDIAAGAELSMSGIAVTNGRSRFGGAIRNHGELTIQKSVIANNMAVRDGGGIYNSGKLAVLDTTIANNSTGSPLGKGGGGVFNTGMLTVERSTLSSNSTKGGFVGEGGGGAIFNDTESEVIVRLTNTTISGNQAVGGSGGGFYLHLGNVVMTHVTVVENEAVSTSKVAGGIFVPPGLECLFRGALDRSCSLLLQNSIVALNDAFSDDDVTGFLESNGGNLIGRVGTASGLEDDLFGDVVPLDPLLGPLGSNGGLTQTHRLLEGSPAIAGAMGARMTGIMGAPLTENDQRNIRRPSDSQIVADIHSGGAFSQFFVESDTPVFFDGEFFFVANDGESGRELWRSDGTPEGTNLVRDINPDGESDPRELTVFRGHLFFSADDGSHGRELWKTDGTAAGTEMVLDLTQTITFGGGRPEELTIFGGSLFFSAYTEDTGFSLFKSDGSASGTEVISAPGPRDLNAIGDALYFSAYDEELGRELWALESGSIQPRMIADIIPGPEGAFDEPSINVDRGFVQFGSDVYFVADGPGRFRTELWKTDGTETGTNKVAPVPPLGPGFRFPTELTVYGDKLYFTAFTDDRARLLWETDGTSLGTIPATIGREMNWPRDYVILDDQMFLATQDALWRTDGSVAGTQQVVQLNGTGFRPRDLTVVGDNIYFTTGDDATGRELWVTDGTSGGSFLAADITPGPDSSFHNRDENDIEVVGDLLFVSTRSNVNDPSNVLLYDPDVNVVRPMTIDVPMVRSSVGSSPSDLAMYENAIYFSANDGIHGQELWRSDGTVAGTNLVADIRTVGGSNPRYLTVHKGDLYFTAVGDGGREQLWRYDATDDSAPVRVAPGVLDNPFWRGNSHKGMTSYGDYLYFAADAGEDDLGAELWRTDGTTEGTEIVRDIQSPGSGNGYGSFPKYMSVFDGDLYFTADDGTHGRELWRTDGTEAGTRMVRDLMPGSEGAFRYGRPMTVYKNALYFSADDGVIGTEVWKSDGTEAGTVPVADLAGGHRIERDGSLAPVGSKPSQFAVFDGLLYFAAGGATSVPGGVGYELWVTDGTAEGTRFAFDVAPGFTSSGPEDLISFDGSLYFSAAFDGVERELWKSDGTPDGTYLVADVHPTIGSDPMELTVLEGHLYFTANDGSRGRELHRLAPQQSIGAVQRHFGSVSGTLYNDANSNGSRDEDEIGLDGWTVFADLNGNGAPDIGEPNALTRNDDRSTAIDESGDYIINDLLPGVYELDLVPTSGFDATFPVNVSSSSTTTHEIQLERIPVEPLGLAGVQSAPAISAERLIFQDDEFQLYVFEDNVTGRLIPGDAVADAGRLAPARDAGFAVDGDSVAFVATDESGSRLAYLLDGQGTITSVSNYPDFDTGVVEEFSVDSVSNELVAFRGRTSNPILDFGGVGAPHDDLTVLVSTGRTIALDTAGPLPAILCVGPDAACNRVTFDALEQVEISSGSFAVLGVAENGPAIIRGTVVNKTLIADSTTSIPRGIGTFEDLRGLIYTGDKLFFRGLGTPRRIGMDEVRQDGIYAVNEGKEFQVVADTLASVPNGVSTFTEFGSFAEDSGNVVFVGQGRLGQHGIYVSIDGAINKIADRSDTALFDDRQPLTFSLGRDAIEGNRVAFHVEFEDGTEDIFLATLPASAGHTISLDVAERKSHVDFGVSAAPGDIVGVVFNDSNADGQRDDGEAGLGGWSVYIDQNSNRKLDVGEIHAVTNEQGQYSFTLPALTEYAVFAIAPESEESVWASTAVGRTGEQSVQLSADEKLTLDFGFAASESGSGAGAIGRIQGTVYRDFGEAGSDAEDAPLQGQRVFLDNDRNGIRSAEEPVTTTNEDGKYEFTELPPGVYAVVLDPAENIEQTLPLGNVFETRVNREVQERPAAILAVQVGDMVPDLFVANNTSNTVTRLSRGSGTGAFGDVIVEDVGGGPIDIASADFNNDGQSDVAVANLFTTYVSLLMQTGGADYAEMRVEVGRAPNSLLADDFNNDGRSDLVVTTKARDSASLNILLNTGEAAGAGFQIHRLPLNSVPSDVTSGDWDNDGMLDLAVSFSSSDRVTVFLNEGGGEFSSVGNLNIEDGRRPIAVVAADLNDDGNADIAVANRVTGTATIFFGDGDGMFGVTRELPVGRGPNSIEAVDIENDGDIDLVATIIDNTPVAILRNNGDGTFQAPELAGADDLEVTSLPLSLTAADLDQDGDPDLAVANGEDGSITILRNRLEPGRYLAAVSGDQAIVEHQDFWVQTRNLAPTISLPEDTLVIDGRPTLVGDEDTPLVLQISVGAGESEENQLVRVQVVSSNDSLFSQVDVTPPVGLGGHRTLSLVPVPDKFGSSDLEIKVTDAGEDGQFGTLDDGMSYEDLFVDIRPVNDAPVLNQIPNEILTVGDDGRVFIALQIDAGPDENEEDQPLRIAGTSSNVSIVPEITEDNFFYNTGDKQGFLVFEAVTIVPGSSTITVVVTDGGLDEDLSTALGNGQESYSFEVVVEPSIAFVGGDFDNNGVVDQNDIDLLFAAINSQPASPRFDLNGDDSVDEDDVSVLIDEILGTVRGDANLDRKVDIRDFLTVSRSFGSSSAGWENGDFDGDSAVSVRDFLALSRVFGFDESDE